MPDFLFSFQTHLVTWALRKGRPAIFADCGLGKTAMQLVWAWNVYLHTGRPVLIVTPLAVATQTEIEARKFGIEAAVSRNGKAAGPITVTNYDRLHLFTSEDYAGVVCDESSAIKAFDGARRALVTEFLRKLPYRLLCTATAAPNDYIELGTSSEALGELGYMDMLNRFFTNDRNSSATGRGYLGEAANWRFKGHAEQAFWRWVSSWARAIRRPSDLGYSDDGFALPELIHRQHVVKTEHVAEGVLFNLPATGLREEREEARRTIGERCAAAAERLTDARHGIAWCQLNPEGDLLTREIDGAAQVKGSDHVDAKEEILTAFSRGEIRVLVTKPSIAGWGLNWQHCNRMTFFPSHSYEQYYQAVRRCWRFGQQHPVTVDIVTTEGAARALASLERKAKQADRMFDSLVAHMRGAVSIRRSLSYDTPVEVPSWAS
ncbi:helicase-related protein [Actinoplanes sp. CA-142083]|uniref:helicase-related protein n=1 Tax=Actinoplanes sp. CA-142083 TaxID=3239903 RepID=UPI003D8BF2A8